METTATLAVALQHHRAGDLDQAEQLYRHLVSADPAPVEALHGLGGIAYQRGQHEQAVDWLRRAAALQPENATLRSNLGAAYRATGRLTEAEDCYRQALRKKPDLAEAYNNLANLLRERGYLDEAVARYRQAVLARLNYVEALANLGLALAEQGLWQEAADCFQQAARGRPAHAETHSCWGLALAAQGKFEEAVVQLREALRLRPNSAKEYFNLAVALLPQGHLEEAASYLQEAVRLQPDWVETYHTLSLVMNQRGRRPEARAYLAQALRLNPDLAWALGQADPVLLLLRHVNNTFQRFRPPPEATPSPVPLRPGPRFAAIEPTELAQAMAQRREALRLGPASAATCLELAALCQQQGNWEEAAEACQKALSLKPDSAEAHAQLGSIRRRQQRLDEVLVHCREAVQLGPELAEAHVALGIALAMAGRLEEATIALQQALYLQPDNAEAYLHLGAALSEQGHVERAAGYLQQALRLQPDLVAAHNKLGLALTEQGRLEEAVAAYREALRLAPDSVPALSHLGTLLEELSQPEEGRRLLERALARGPQECQVHTLYGTSLVNQGRFDEARLHFLQARALQPDFAPAYFCLARDNRYRFSDAERTHVKELLARESLSLRDRINLHFALAHVHDRERNFDDAFLHCERGNAAKQQLVQLQGNAFQSDRHAQFVDRIIATFDRSYFEKAQHFGRPSDLPVFIVGMPRSGTSLVEQILASHPSVFGGGELRQMKQFLADLPAQLASPADFPDCLDRLERGAADRLGERYLQELRRLGGSKLRVTDKMPMNFHQLGLIATLLPGARIIHCRRDARDVCWSCYFQNFREIHFACDLEKLAAYFRQYERLMAHWKDVLPVPVLEVVYEELVADVEGISRAIVAHCQLPWDEGCLTFHETPRLVRTSSNRQVRQPIYKGSVGYWKNYAAHLGPLLEALGQL